MLRTYPAHAIAGRRSAQSIVAQILAEYGSAAQLLLLAEDDDDYRTLITGKGSVWIDQSGKGLDATQDSDPNRPTWAATGFNGLPEFSFDGGDFMQTGTVDFSTFTGFALHALARDSITTTYYLIDWASGTGSPGMKLRANVGAAGDQEMYGSSSNLALARSAAGAAALTTPALVTGTWDQSLTTNEAEILLNGVNVTSTRPNNGNNTTAPGTFRFTLGARDTGAQNMTGSLRAVVAAAWADGVAAHATAIGNVNDVLQSYGAVS